MRPARRLHVGQNTRSPARLPWVLSFWIFWFSWFDFLHVLGRAHSTTAPSWTSVVTDKPSSTVLLAKPVSQPTHQRRPLSYFQSERGQISPRVLTL